MLQSWFCWYHASCLCFRAAVCSVLCEPPVVTNASVVVLLVSRSCLCFTRFAVYCVNHLCYQCFSRGSAGITRVVCVSGPRFAVYCVNHLLLPMLQSWLRRGARICGYWDSGAINFKQCCGHMSDLVVDFISRFKGISKSQLLINNLPPCHSS